MAKQRWHAATGVASAAVLVIVLVAWAATAIFAGDGSASGSAVTHPIKRTDLSWGSRCGLPHGSQDPIVGPPAASWTLVGHVAAPFMPAAGPAVIADHDRRCYAHSPLGALFAAANLIALGSLPNHAIPEPQALDHVVPGHLRDVYAHQPPILLPPQTVVSIVGFQMDVLGRDDVNVTLAIRVNGVLGYAVWPMRWTMPNGDWRVEPLSVTEPVDAGPLDSLAGYVPWTA